MKKLLILSSLTLILAIPSNQTLEVNAASDPVIDSYSSIYTSLKMDETKRIVYLDTIIKKGDGIYSKTLESIAQEEQAKEEEKKEE